MGEGKDRQPTGGGGPERGRFTTRRKQELVLRLFRGEPLETVSRDVGVTAATLSLGATSSSPVARRPSRADNPRP
jgi:hypothetical protein